MKLKFVSVVLVLMLVVSILCGCSDDLDISENTAGKNSWTIMVYMCGTDLEGNDGSATDDINEMLSADLNESINVLIETGGTSEWQNDIVDSSKLQRYKVEDGEIVLKDEQELASMGEPNTLTSFLKWGKEEYPADKYMMVFWNHGGGSGSGVCFDEVFDGDYLSIAELSNGIKDSGVNFEVIGYDTCLMATLENASAIAPYGKYMVASEETESGYGWDYTTWLNYLSTDSSMSGAQLGKNICDGYYESCENSGEEASATLSVVDLSKIADVKAKFTDFATEMAEDTVDVKSLKALVQGALKTEKYGGSTDAEGYSNMVDLADLAENTSGVIKEKSDALIEAIQSSVVYSKNGASCSKAKGISVYYPISANTSELDVYATSTDVEEYLTFISAICDEWKYESKIDVEPVSKDDYEIKFKTKVNDDGYYQLNISSGLDIVESVKFELYLMDEENDEYLRLGLDDDIESNWDKGVFEDNFRGVWFTIGDCYVAPELIYQGDDYNLYSVPILLNGESTNLRIMYDANTEKFSILGIYDGVSENGMSSKESQKLKNGDKITFLFEVFSDDNYELAEMGSIEYSDDILVTESDLFDGKYMYCFEINDIFGNSYYSDYAVINYEDGEIELE